MLDGVELTRIGLGTNRLTDTPGNRELLEAAVQAGVNFVDTAHAYTGGESERTIGAALAPFRDSVIVATKGGMRGATAETLAAEVEESLRRLQTDAIDLYYLHRVDPEVPIETSVEEIDRHREHGRIHRIGLSEVDVEQIERARAVAPIAAVQNRYSVSERRYDEVVDYCAMEKLRFVPFYPLRGHDEVAALSKVATRRGATAAQIALAWLLKRSPTMLPIPGTLSLEHLRENLGALEIELTDEEFAALG